MKDTNLTLIVEALERCILQDEGFAVAFRQDAAKYAASEHPRTQKRSPGSLKRAEELEETAKAYREVLSSLQNE
jgi:hypothetical protein